MTTSDGPISILGQGAAVLDEIAHAHALLAFDYDGTLAPIVEDRRAALMRPETWELLRSLALLYPCAVISGRARPDLAGRVDRIPLVAVVGNHGAEPGWGPLDRGLERRAHEWAEALREALRDLPGVEVEEKRLGLAVHYRRAPSWPEALERVQLAAAALPGARVSGGHAVVNVMPADAPDKGDAIRAVRERHPAPLAVYVGDDETDEDVFRDPDVISIRVGPGRLTAARYCISSQLEIDDLLRAFIRARARHDGLAGRFAFGPATGT